MYDYHSHTDFSDDSNAKMSDMVEAAISKSIKELAITDHYDPDYADTSMPFILDFEGYHKEMEVVKKKYNDYITVVKGIEIGIQNGHTVKKCVDAAISYPYDFIIGSFHSACGFTIDQPEYHENRDSTRATVDYYDYMLNSLKEFNDYDVLGHINVIDRYIDHISEKTQYIDYVEAILRHLIDNGKGLEINTSSFRYGLGDRTTPPFDILKLYVDMGGEIITTGSDAHSPKDVGYMLEFAQDMILRTGHKYVATFRERKVIQQKIQ